MGCGANANAGANTNRTTYRVNGVVEAAYCYDHADRMTSTTQAGYTGAIIYDTRGNTTLLAGDTHTYDGTDRHMRTVNGTTTVTYQRDLTGRIVTRTAPDGSTRYGHLSGSDTTAVTLTNANAMIERTLPLPAGVLLTTNSTTGDVWSHPNLQGSITATSNATGTKQSGPHRYDPYGTPISAVVDNTTGAIDFTWLGQHQRPHEHATGITPTIQMGARPYHTTLGRFLATDPILGGVNNDYNYPNDPRNSADLSGRWVGGICMTAALAAIAGGSGGVCFVSDGNHTGFTFTVGIAAGIEMSIGAGFYWSNAPDIFALGGESRCVGGGIYTTFFGGEFCWWGSYIGLYVGAGIGVGVHFSQVNTRVVHIKGWYAGITNWLARRIVGPYCIHAKSVFKTAQIRSKLGC